MKALPVLTTACHMNKKSVKDLDIFIDAYKVPKESEQNASIFDLLRFGAIRRNQLILNACWLSFSMGYYGLTYNTPTFNLNPFLMFSIPGIVATGLSLIEPFMENKYETDFTHQINRACKDFIPDLVESLFSPQHFFQPEYSS